jgi:hypothetical protein
MSAASLPPEQAHRECVKNNAMSAADVRTDTKVVPAAEVAVDAALFERELTELSRKHRIGITGSMTLFVMEPDDFERRYSSDEKSQLQFA